MSKPLSDPPIPAAADLLASMRRRYLAMTKACGRCEKDFIARGHYQKWCPDCKAPARRDRERNKHRSLKEAA